MKLKKSLGQNFFNNPTLAVKICNEVLTSKPKRIFEIGPGDGYFTKLFLENGADIAVIEKDSELTSHLRSKFGSELKIYNEDFLNFNLQKLDLKNGDVFFGSLPYNVSKLIIKKLLEETKVEDFFFILQKEVAIKFATELPNSILFSVTKIFADTKVLFHISSGSFIPRPKVESSFIHFKRNSNNLHNLNGKFIQFVKVCFAKPRKTLKNNIQSYLKPRFNNQYLSMRPEQLTYIQLVELFKLVNGIIDNG